MDFALTSVFVVPVGNTLPTSGSTENLTDGQFGIFRSDYSVATAANITAKPYFYIAQGRHHNYLLSSKRSAKISSTGKNVLSFRKVLGCSSVNNQITEIGTWKVKCGDIVTVTIRAHSTYLETVSPNGFTKSVTVQAPCCACGADPCTDADIDLFINDVITALNTGNPGFDPAGIRLSDLFTFTKVGTGPTAVLRITGKPLNKYGQPCDPAAFPYDYDRLWFQVFVYEGPATSADPLVLDKCKSVATVTTTQNSNFPSGHPDQVKQLEKNFYSYQAGFAKHLHRMGGFNQNFKSYVSDTAVYDSFYITLKELDEDLSFQDAVGIKEEVIIFVPQTQTAAIEAILTAALGSVTAQNTCV